VNRAVPAERLHEEALALARKISEASGPVVGLGKGAFYVQIDLAQEAAYGYAKEVMSLNAMADDAQEGMAAFIERRQPHWRNKETSVNIS
jgi:enoyl-CoA hydratase/carnithine racemase